MTGERLVAPVGSESENPPDFGEHESTIMLELVTGPTNPAETTGDIGGRPPSFPWSGHSNGVSSNR